MSLWKYLYTAEYLLFKNVSILVLLDVALKDTQLYNSLNKPKCFNPCSLGCRSESDFLYVSYMNLIQFQSLFSWMSLWKTVLLQGDRGPCLVSILVLLDVALKVSLPQYTCIWYCVCFNPCSLGCRSERISVMFVKIRIVSFNPCSLGCRSERKSHCD